MKTREDVLIIGKLLLYVLPHKSPQTHCYCRWSWVNKNLLEIYGKTRCCSYNNTIRYWTFHLSFVQSSLYLSSWTIIISGYELFALGCIRSRYNKTIHPLLCFALGALYNKMMQRLKYINQEKKIFGCWDDYFVNK